MRRRSPLAIVVLLMVHLPIVAVGVLVGVIFGWRVPVAYVILVGVLMALPAARRHVRPAKRFRRLRATTEFVAFALTGAVSGVLLFGGLGAFFGFVLGFTARLSEVPITSGPSFRFLRRGRA
jgi:uncharacterized membrane protein YedE/YeeE